MHELDHNLGLDHGGTQGDPNDSRFNWKPNYCSVMNYTWTIPWPVLKDSWTLDYSGEVLPTLRENSLMEGDGIDGPVGKRTFGPHIVLPGDRWPGNYVIPMNGPVNWNQDGDAIDTGVQKDINRIGSSLPATPGDTLLGAEDWSRLRYQIGGHPNFEHGVFVANNPPEITFEQFIEMGG